MFSGRPFRQIMGFSDEEVAFQPASGLAAAQLLPSAERAVCADHEGDTTVVLEANPPIQRRLCMGAGTPVPPQLAAQRDPEPAPATLFVIPFVPIIGRSGRPVLQPQPSLVNLVVVSRVITRPQPARHQSIPHYLEQTDRLQMMGSAQT